MMDVVVGTHTGSERETKHNGEPGRKMMDLRGEGSIVGQLGSRMKQDKWNWEDNVIEKGS